MTVEPDLAGLVDQPMVFGVYGRARVLEPFVGKGITVDNLTQLVDFVTGACSCQVKDANPGLDLLTTWNWDATADRIAGKDPPLDRAGGGYAEIGTAGQAGSGTPAKQVASGEWRVASKDSPRRQGAAPGPKTKNAAAPGELFGVTGIIDPGLGPETKNAAAPGQTASDSASSLATRHSPLDTPSFAHRLAWRLGMGLLLGAVVVLAAGLVLIRHRDQSEERR
jgi:hypothetical protein